MRTTLIICGIMFMFGISLSLYGCSVDEVVVSDDCAMITPDDKYTQPEMRGTAEARQRVLLELIRRLKLRVDVLELEVQILRDPPAPKVNRNPILKAMDAPKQSDYKVCHGY